MTVIATPGQSQIPHLARVARFPGLRVLAWSRDILYAARGYHLMSAQIQNPSDDLRWKAVAKFNPGWARSLSATNFLSARLFRDGFHGLVVLPFGGLVGAIPGAIVTLNPGEGEFHRSHVITRGTRPLHITAVPGGAIFWGEYFDNSSREEVHIYASSDSGNTWRIAYTFPKRSIRHIHNIVHDPWGNCIWILTGDNGDECRILRASCDLSRVEVVLQGNQQARAVAAVATEHALYFASDTPLESNFVYRLDRGGKASSLAGISSSSLYGCKVGRHLFFSTMVEPSEVNRDRSVRVYCGDPAQPGNWNSALAWKKDSWPSTFQYGNAIFPDGPNETPFLALTTIAVQSEDLVTSLYRIDP